MRSIIAPLLPPLPRKNRTHTHRHTQEMYSVFLPTVVVAVFLYFHFYPVGQKIEISRPPFFTYQLPDWRAG